MIPFMRPSTSRAQGADAPPRAAARPQRRRGERLPAPPRLAGDAPRIPSLACSVQTFRSLDREKNRTGRKVRAGCRPRQGRASEPPGAAEPIAAAPEPVMLPASFARPTDPAWRRSARGTPLLRLRAMRIHPLLQLHPPRSRRPAILGALLSLGATACDFPTALPKWDATWQIAGEHTRIPVDSLLPPG